MAENKVKLYGFWASPFSTRVEIALKLKGVEYEYVEENLRNKSHDLLRYNPIYKQVPVLVHGNKHMAESHVIIEYIDETWGSCTHSILPQDPHQRALARFWARFIDDKLMSTIVKAFWLKEEQAMQETLENLQILEMELEGKRFFGGEMMGFADIVGISAGYWLGAIEDATGKVIITEEVFPSMWKWRDELVKCNVIQQSVPPRDELVTFLKSVIEAKRIHASD
ncbi:hypothetical protein V2J09_015796 [Rumex salicifolius]